MSHYFQLLGSDTPNGYGGCCYYGPLDHPVFLESSTGSTASTTERDTQRTGTLSHVAVVAGSSVQDTTAERCSFSTHKDEGSSDSSTGHAHAHEGSAAGASAAPWNWSSYLHAPRPTWPTTGPLHLATLLRPTPPPGASSTAAAAAAAAPHVTADTGSSGNEGYIFFNCPEGAQRFSSEANIKLKKVRCFCFTRWNSAARSCAATTGAVHDAGSFEKVTVSPSRATGKGCAVGAASAAMGLPGMLFTINDAGSRQATFFGPSVIVDYPCASTSGGASAQSQGLRGFLTALRFHYFQYRPMLFRQLHGALACTQASAPTRAVLTATVKAATAGNLVEFVEVAEATCAGRDGRPPESPFFHATIPLSGQSLLVAFRISGGKGGRTIALLEEDGCVGSASASLFSLREPALQRNEEGEPQTTDASMYAVPDSSEVVLGYAVVVAPGAAFDAGAARALGVRSGPKYGQLKHGISVEADDVESTTCTTSAKPSTQTGASTEQGTAPSASDDSTPMANANSVDAARARRWVHPSQVMRPTGATRHAYVSLVLDGDAPEDVRHALGSLLGRTSDTTAENKNTRGEAGDVQDAPSGAACDGGALLKLLRVKFPHLAYYHDVENTDDADGAAVPSGTEGQRAVSFVQRPRQLTVRHVAHVQPSSYFENFQRSREAASVGVVQQEPGAVQALGSENSAPSMPAADTNLYAAYNSFIFADVMHHTERSSEGLHAKACTAVQVSLDPSLSFTLSDLAEDAEVKDAAVAASAEERASESLSMPTAPAGDGLGAIGDLTRTSPHRSFGPPHTWHLFTSFVQRHYTAFPTALVHRYHLHHLAPSLFPLHGSDIRSAGSWTLTSTGLSATPSPSRRGNDGAEVSTALSSAASAGAARPSTTEEPVEYWPYSLKLRCVPEAAVQLSSKQTSKGSPAKPASTAPPLKREKKDALGHAAPLHANAPTPTSSAPQVKDQCAAQPPLPSSPSSSSAPQKAVMTHAGKTTRPVPAAAARHLAVIDGQTSLLPYPTPASALALLSGGFLASMSPSALTAPAAREERVDVKGERHEMSKDGHCFSDARNGIDSGALGGGGALGFLGTGSAVPSKYRNVSGTYLELFLPRCCFGGVEGSIGEAHNAGDDRAVCCAGGGERGHLTGEAGCVQRDAVARTSQAEVPLTNVSSSPSASLPSRCTELRRGVIILDFGEGSAGQLASLCEGVRGGARDRQAHHPHRRAAAMMQTCNAATSPLHAGHETPKELGEETWRQDTRGAAEDGLRSFVLDVVLVFISHAHADHHLGLLSLLTLRHHYLSQQSVSPSSESPKLLIVCPTEVYQFVMHAWGQTAPYREWLHEECAFELLPPPLRSAIGHEVATTTMEPSGEREVTAEALKNSAACDMRYAAQEGGSHKGMKPDDKVGHRCGSRHHVIDAAAQQQQQHVVPVPLLQAQLRKWNTHISQHVHTHQRQKQQQQLADTEDGNEASLLRSPCSPPCVGAMRWDAEVITVDHPANAHALLLRFPFCTALSTDATAATNASSHASPGMLPDASRVFLFSGDTRPSRFLVERSRAFTAGERSCRAECAPATTSPMPLTTPPVFILLHEATFGPGFEGEAVRKKHSTLPEALEIGAAVQAEFVVLNHFSQRYPKLPGLSSEQLGGRSVDLVCQSRPRGAAAAAEAVEVSEGTRAASTEADREEREEGPQRQASHQAEEAGSLEVSLPTTSPYANMSFAFDLMSVSFTNMHRGLVPRLTPALVRLLEEYESWGVSTTHRMRTTQSKEKSSNRAKQQ